MSLTAKPTKAQKPITSITPRLYLNKATAAAMAMSACLLYTSDAADEEDSVDLGGRRIIKKKKKFF